MSPARDAREDLEGVMRAALAAVHAGSAVGRALRVRDGVLAIAGHPLAAGVRVRALAIGKAGAPMLAALEGALGDRLEAGLAIVKDGHGAEGLRSRLLFAAHPVPDRRSEAAAREALAFVAAAPREVATVVLLSGGASSLIACPAEGLTLEDIAATTSLLLGSGAAIDEVNCVRKELSAVGGGRLGLAATSERVDVLVVSDVPGDRLDVIGSGPFVPNTDSAARALEILEERRLVDRLPPAVVTYLEGRRDVEAAGAATLADDRLRRVHTTLLASNAVALEAAAQAAAACGMEAVIVTRELAGEARLAGRRLAALALEALREPGGGRSRCLIAGGETTVTLRGAGRGGRNQELALAASLALAGHSGVALLAVGTDGSDGPTPAAGAFVDGGTVARAASLGWDARTALRENDSYGFFAAEGGLVVTGPTATNVMDLVLVSVEAG